jgi:molybdate transport system substrate-binding protein
VPHSPLTRRSFVAAFAPADLLIAAASDLAPLETQLRRLAPGGAARFTFGSSGLLARQVENGAPYDLFLSADAARAEALARAKKLTGTTAYAVGRVALWSKSGAWRTLEDLAQRPFRHLALANPAHAPYGKAARQALERAGLWKRVENRSVLAENVRQAWQFAESGNAEVCLTAWSLVHHRQGILVDSSLHDALRQVGGVVTGSPRRTRAAEMLKALTGEAGQRLFLANGFESAI